MGPLAHLVERIVCNDEVTGSSPVRSTALGLYFVRSLLVIGLKALSLITGGQQLAL